MEGGAFEVEEIEDEGYSLDNLAERWRTESAAGRTDAKQWAAGRVADLRYDALSSPFDAAAALLALKAGIVLLASRSEPRADTSFATIQDRLRACYGQLRHGAIALDSLFLPYDSDSVFDARVSERVAFQTLELERYAASAEASWLAILALTGSLGLVDESADFVRTPEVAHAMFVQLNATSPTLSMALERCVAYMVSHRREKRSGELSLKEAAALIRTRLSSILGRTEDDSVELDVEDVFAFWGLLEALRQEDTVRSFAELSALLAGGLGSRFDERGAPLRAPKRASAPAHPAAPIVASMVREWNAHGDLPRKLLSGKHLPADGSTEEDVHARLEFSPQPWSAYLRRRILALDEDAVLARFAPLLLDPFASAVREGRMEEEIDRLRMVDSAEKIGAAGPAIVFLLQDESKAVERAKKLAPLLAPAAAAAAEALGVRAPYGSEHFIGPKEAIFARPVQRSAENFMLAHWDKGSDEPVRAIAVKTHLLDELGKRPVEREVFSDRTGWQLVNTKDSAEVAVSSEAGPVLLGAEPVGFVRIVNVVRTDNRAAKKQARVPVQPTSGSSWFAPLDAPNASKLRDLFSPDSRLLRLYQAKAEQMLGKNKFAVLASAEPDDAVFRERAIQLFGATRVEQTKTKREAGRPAPLRLGARAGRKGDNLLLYGQLSLGRFSEQADEAFVLQIVTFVPLSFRIADGDLAIFPFAMPALKAVPSDWTLGANNAAAAQVLENGAETFFRAARISGRGRTDQIPVASKKQYESWFVIGKLPLEKFRVVDGGPLPEALRFEERHYVFLPDSQIYASQQNEKDAFQVSFLWADAVAALLSSKEGAKHRQPAPSSGYEASDFGPGVPASPQSLEQVDRDWRSDEPLAASLLGDSPPSEALDAYYSNVVASAVLDHSEPEDREDRPLLQQIRDRLSALLARNKAPVFFGDARFSAYNEDALGELGTPDYMFSEHFFADKNERPPSELIRRAFLEPLDALEAHHLKDDPRHLAVVQTFRTLLLYDETQLRDDLNAISADDLPAFCEAQGLVPQALDIVRDLWTAAREPAGALISNELLLRRFFLPSAYVEGRPPSRSYFGWLSFTDATAQQYRFPNEGTTLVLGMCGLYAVAEGRRMIATLTF